MWPQDNPPSVAQSVAGWGVMQDIQPPLGQLPCVVCGRTIGDHGGLTHRLQLPDGANERLTDQEWRRYLSFVRRYEKGELDPPLPAPRERKRLRKAAGLSQEDIGDLIGVSRHQMIRFERRAGCFTGRRLAGREPVGEARRAYAKVLRNSEALLRRGSIRVEYGDLLKALDDSRDS